ASGSGTGTPSSGAPSGTPTPPSSGGTSGAHVASSGAAPAGAQASAGGERSSGAPASSGGKTSSGGKAPAAAGPASTTQSAQPGVNHGVITVGGIYDETGPIDATVERDTVRSYFNLVNSQGGVNGYKFQLVDCDSKYDPSSAHQCAQKLISQGV